MKEKFEVVNNAVFDCLCLLDDEEDEDVLHVKVLTRFRRINKELEDIQKIMDIVFVE
jgi:hypothetical protein